ncbi:T9SS type A sorting domain-containing protein [Taibaiella koreensis]|uniref:T9SS type A sorting domain-containing protein n=1 Tax=Taibaiella koreensis TaxID=1268548 RepID=UPI000E59F0A2|nr:T9SS type A sorting domain-containing protein [Taibaiella koreensis]
MKKICILYLALGIACHAAAQTLPATSKEQRRQTRDYILNLLLNRVGTATANKPTAIEQRLIAIKLDDNIGELSYYWDTTRLYYSGNRGSRFNRATCQFNTGVSALNAPVAEGLGALPATMDEVKPDSLVYKHMNGLWERQVVSYQQQNLVQKYTYTFSGGSLPFSYAVGYDNGNHIQNVMYYQGSNDTTTKRKLHYNTGFTRVVSDSSYYVGSNTLLPPLSIWTYTYDAGDRITELERVGIRSDGQQVSYNLYYFTYYPDGRLQTIKSYAAIGAGYLPEQADSFTYDGTHTVYQGRYIQDYEPSGQPATLSWETKHFNAAGLTDTIYYYVGGINPNPDAAVSYNVIEYNAFDNPVTQKTIQRGAPAAFRVYRYYYENYETEMAIGGAMAQYGSISVYPNPFTDQVHVGWKGTQPLKKAQLYLTDYQGRIGYRWEQDLTTGDNVLRWGKRPVPGNYLLVIRGAGGEQIVKKLVCR